MLISHHTEYKKTNLTYDNLKDFKCIHYSLTVLFFIPLRDIFCFYMQVLKEFVCTWYKKTDFYFPSLKYWIRSICIQYFPAIQRNLGRNYHTVVPDITKDTTPIPLPWLQIEHVPSFFRQLNLEVFTLCDHLLWNSVLNLHLGKLIFVFLFTFTNIQIIWILNLK